MVDVSKFLVRADDAFKKRNYDYAIQMYLEALQVDPGHLGARMTLRTVLLKAVSDGSKIVAPPTKTMVLTRDPKIALAEHEKSVVKDPRSVKYNMRVADALRELKFNESAGNVYQYVIDYCDKGKENVDAMKKGAQAFIDAQKPEMAQKLLAKAMRVAQGDKELADLQRNVAASTTLSNIASAKSSRDMLKNSDQAAELELLNKKVFSPDELKRAYAIVEGKLGASPLDKGLIKKKAELMSKAHKYNEAYDYLMQKYKEIEGAQDLAELAVKYKNTYFEAALKFCDKKIQEEPEKAAAYQAKAKQLKQERARFQLDEYKRQVDEAPADLDKRYFFGKALFDAGMSKEAVEHLQKAIKSPKYDKQAGILLGRCFAQLKRVDLAIRQLSMVLPLVPEDQEDMYLEIRYWLADAYELQGDKPKAIELFQELFMANAAFRDVGERLEGLQGE